MDMADRDRMALKQMIEDLTGQSFPFDVPIPNEAVKLLQPNTSGLGYSQFNELLLFLGYDRVCYEFFQFLIDGTIKYDGGSIASLSMLRDGVDRFRKIALLFWGNVKFAFKNNSRSSERMAEIMLRTERRDLRDFRKRHTQIMPPHTISGDDTYYLGYIIEKELKSKLQKNPKDRVARAEENKRQGIVARGRENHKAYLVSDHLDVYVATSMRERHEFRNVFNTARAIFAQQELRDLKLRYFDPTQAYCSDRIDKGLAEALMLKRARCTIYFAQENDTLGKDSELASTLAQGKVVIAYVPTPTPNAAETIAKDAEAEGMKPFEAIMHHLRMFDAQAAWNDSEVRAWISSPAQFTRAAGIRRLQQAIENNFRIRDMTLRDVHPLAIQVNLGTGVANGVLVVNSVAQCAKLVRRIMTRELDFAIEEKKIDGQKYLYLRESISNCVFRVVTGDALLTNTFWNFYLNPSYR
jgi:hypothetical protein